MWVRGMSRNCRRSGVSRNQLHGDPFDGGAGFQRYFDVITENRRRYPNLPGNNHVEQSSARNVVDGGILGFKFLDIFLPLQFQHRSYDGYAGVAAGEADFVFELGTQQPLIIFWRQTRWNGVFVITETNVGLAIDGPVKKPLRPFFFYTIGYLCLGWKIVRRDQFIVTEKLQQRDGTLKGVEDIPLGLGFRRNSRRQFLTRPAIRLHFDAGILRFKSSGEIFV